MRRSVFPVVAGLLVLLSSIALAQDKNANIVRVYAMVPKPGMTKQFEDGRKRHMDFHRKQNDTWAWETWVTETGPDTGTYLSVTGPPHTWKEFDDWEAKLGSADGADTQTNLLPYIGGGANSFWMYMKDWSRPMEGMGHPKMAQVNHFLLKPGSVQDFSAAAKKITDAINKANWPGHYAWYSLMDGGEGPHYVLLLYMNSWVGMQEPDPPFMVMLEKTLGRHDAEETMRSVDHCIKREWTETIRYLPELSYEPAMK